MIFGILLFTFTSAMCVCAPAYNILVIGSGGREHAMVHKIRQTSHGATVFVAPGNGGTAQMEGVYNVAIAPTEFDSLVQFAQEKKIDLVMVGPEAPLSEGIVDVFNKVGIACLGPTQKAAQLETSKIFAKQFMIEHNIPTAQYQVITTLTEAEKYIDEHEGPLVIKADGLAGGKGVVITSDKIEAQSIIKNMLDGTTFGDAGKKIVLEQFLTGQEVSIIVLTDGHHYLPLASCQDYKTRNNGNQGPNTGGMGSISPARCLTPVIYERILKEIIEPTIAHMKERGTPFVGFLYAGIMITPEGEPKVLEFNCRLGDPETQ
jgi:phosphoribosylamine--glycine ligase